MVEAELKGGNRLKRKLRSIGTVGSQAMRSAVPKATRSGKTQATKQIGLVLNLTAARIKQQIQSDRDALFVKGWQRGKDDTPTLRAYKATFKMRGRRSAGVAATTWRGLGRQQFPDGFKIPSSEVPFKRRGPKSYPITPIYGPRIGKVFDQISRDLNEFMRGRVRSEWSRAVRGILRRAA